MASKCCCCNVRIDTFSTTDPALEDRYSFTEDHWSQSGGRLHCDETDSELAIFDGHWRLVSPTIRTYFNAVDQWAELRLTGGDGTPLTVRAEIVAAGTPIVGIYTHDVEYTISTTGGASATTWKVKTWVNPAVTFSASIDLFVYFYPHTKFDHLEGLFLDPLLNFVKFDPGCHYQNWAFGNGYERYALAAVDGVEFDNLTVVRPLPECYTIERTCQQLCWQTMPETLVFEVSGLQDTLRVCGADSLGCQSTCDDNYDTCMAAATTPEEECDCLNAYDDCMIACKTSSSGTQTSAPCSELNGSIVLGKVGPTTWDDAEYGSACSDPSGLGCPYQVILESDNVYLGAYGTPCGTGQTTQPMTIQAWIQSTYYDEDTETHYGKIYMNSFLGYGPGGGIYSEQFAASVLCEGECIELDWGEGGPPTQRQINCFNGDMAPLVESSLCDDAIDVLDGALYYCERTADCSSTTTTVIREPSYPDPEVNPTCVSAE